MAKKKVAPRAQEVIDQEYSAEAAQYGHKSRLIAHKTKEVLQLEKENEGHLNKMFALVNEAEALRNLAQFKSVADQQKQAPAPEVQKESA